MQANRFGAFVPGVRAFAAPLGRGPLDDLRLAVKDLIDVEGVITTGGNPDWAASHAPAARHAACVRRLLEAGATLVGKTVTDELAFSLEGENVHHGTPVNPRAPGRLPGGSSSGSAVAVAAGEADIALGTDTGGSVRIPAAFCGVFGFRPTHGRIALDGVLPFAPSYDTVGWMASDGARLEAVGRVLLDDVRDGHRGTPNLALRWAGDIAALAEPTVRELVQAAATRLDRGAAIDAFGGDPRDAGEAYRVLQGAEIRASLGGWIASQRPRFGPAIAQRFDGLASIAGAEVDRWSAWRRVERARLDALLGATTAIVFPTAPCPALLRSSGAAQRSDFYAVALAVNALAGHAGLPQVTLPAGQVDGAPVGLSILGPRGSDLRLLALAAAWSTACA